MSIIAINESWKQEGSTQSIGAVRESKRHIQVILDEYMSPDIIRRDARLPRDGNAHPTDPSQYCVSVDISPSSDSSRIMWDVVADYSSDVDNEELEISKKGGTGEPPNPFDDPPEISFTSGQRQVAVYRGRPIYPSDGTESIQNTAGDVFDPPAMMTIAEPGVRITRNEASFSYQTHLKPYINRTNIADFSGARKGQVLCSAIDATVNWERNVKFYRVTYQFAYRPYNLNAGGPSGYDGEDVDNYPWAIHQPNVGFYAIRGTPTVPVNNDFNQIAYTKQRIKDVFGEDVQVAQFLDLDGQLRQAGDDGNVRPIFLSWHVYGEADFNTLNLGV